MKIKEDIISYEPQGWPMYKMTLREIIEHLGFELKDGKWQMEDTNPFLDVYPLRLQDDGMGYGVNEEYIIETSVLSSGGKNYCNFFTEPMLKNIELWKKSEYRICSFVHEIKNPNVNLTIQDIKEQDGKLFYLCYEEYGESGKWLCEDDIDWGWKKEEN